MSGGRQLIEAESARQADCAPLPPFFAARPSNAPPANLHLPPPSPTRPRQSPQLSSQKVASMSNEKAGTIPSMEGSHVALEKNTLIVGTSFPPLARSRNLARPRARGPRWNPRLCSGSVGRGPIALSDAIFRPRRGNVASWCSCDAPSSSSQLLAGSARAHTRTDDVAPPRVEDEETPPLPSSSPFTSTPRLVDGAGVGQPRCGAGHDRNTVAGGQTRTRLQQDALSGYKKTASRNSGRAERRPSLGGSRRSDCLNHLSHPPTADACFIASSCSSRRVW